MKIIITILTCLFTTIIFSQKNNDIYILINNQSKIDTIVAKNDTLKIEIFSLKLNSNYLKYNFYKDSAGNLQKKITVKSQKSKVVKLEYINNHKKNLPFLISEHSKLNMITFDEMLKNKDFIKLLSLIRSYKNIFIINKDNKCDDYYIVKKVTLKVQVNL